MLAMGKEFDKISGDEDFAELEADKPKVDAVAVDTEVSDFFNSFFGKGPKEAVVHLALDPTPISTAEIMAATVPAGADGSDQTLEDILGKALYLMADDMDARTFEMAKHAMASGIVRVFTQAGFVRMKRFDTVPTVQEHPTPAPQAPRQEPVPHAEQYPNSVCAEDLDATRPMSEITSVNEPGITAARHPVDTPHFTQIITSNAQPTGARIVNVGAPDDVEKP